MTQKTDTKNSPSNPTGSTNPSNSTTPPSPTNAANPAGAPSAASASNLNTQPIPTNAANAPSNPTNPPTPPSQTNMTTSAGAPQPPTPPSPTNTASPAKPAPPANPTNTPKPSSVETILYIEDDPGSQLLVKRALSFAGYNVIVASRGLEGIDMAIKHLPDLILTDINLPDLSGRELTTRLRSDSRFRNTPIVALTALSQSGEREKALAAGATGYLTKPVDIDKLPKQMDRFMKGEKETVSTEALVTAHEAYNQEVVTRLEIKIRELEENNAELRRLDKIKDDFIQLTAHELRTPLTLMYGYSRLLQESSIAKQLRDSSPELQTVINGMVSSIERMSGVINEILIVSRVATGRVELSLGPTNLAEVVERVVNEYLEVAKSRQVHISFNRAQWPVNMRADAELLRMAISNVVGNAIKYTPDGGIVNMIARSSGNSVLLTFQDTGVGIAKDDQQRIFDRFYTANKTQLHSTSKTNFGGGGLGLGLAICRGIIEAHGGRIWVESDGRDDIKLPGSSFYIDLPMQAHGAARTGA